MIEGWRWYGGYDRISLSEIAQTGAASIVTALHEIPYGHVWPRQTIADTRMQILAAGFDWTVVESLPVHEAIKRGEGGLEELFANYRQSMANLAAEGVKVICYNFMPLLDWTRTDLTAPVGRGGSCLRFSITKMAAFDVFMVDRPGAEEDYSAEDIATARCWLDKASPADREELTAAIMAGLPGAYDRYDAAGLRAALAAYRGFDRTTLRMNHKRFLEEVVPTAEELGLKLAVHPDDPPRNLLGLPRIVSNAEDIGWLLSAVESPANGLTLCAGSLGANPENDVPAIARQFSGKIHFAHLRNVAKEPDGSFEEAPHLAGDTDIPAVIEVLLAEEAARRRQGRADASIVFRPDHGHELLDDAGRGTHPGYPLVGRLRGLAELRGVIAGLTHAGAAA
ncbi:mannonate dehydratase [Roseibium aggregatum]|uniref:Mannonate dehydratase n=1 Tax=Roseibium aggregatum TaxID=187304 RepID=A0A939J5Y0_9HYPH|nr:mannonate dehydratase [Roseibium aggregatum]MBN9672209.1 mannonate dehydratase [Roseibium aggregatum]